MRSCDTILFPPTLTRELDYVIAKVGGTPAGAAKLPTNAKARRQPSPSHRLAPEPARRIPFERSLLRRLLASRLLQFISSHQPISPFLSPPQNVIVAKGLVESLQAKWGITLEVLGEFKGQALEGATYRHPLAGRVSPVVMGGDYITTESGTGLVHTAPGHGQEDYLTGMKYGLPLLSPVDGDGKFTAEAGEEFVGKSVLSDGTAAVIGALERTGCLVLEEAYKHKYPYDWRTKEPTIFRATEQWFASVEGFREAALTAVGEVNWVPAVGEKRITVRFWACSRSPSFCLPRREGREIRIPEGRLLGWSVKNKPSMNECLDPSLARSLALCSPQPMVAGRNDWCISRQRTWGLPIPAFFDKVTGEAVMDADSIAHIQAVFAKHGSDAWWTLDLKELLPEKLHARADSLRKGTDTMDVWFDSGSSWAGVVDTRPDLRWPADLYLEGSDQHRGWFQSSLLTSVAARGKAPYKQVLTHGFVLDEKGFKMSKSLGNVVDPRLVIDGGKDEKQQPPYGADVLRLWVSSVDYTSDVLIGPAILKQMSEHYRKIRGTLRFLLGNLDDFDPAKHTVVWADLPEVDRFALSRLGALQAEVEAGYASFQFARVFQAINTFTSAFLSNFYLDTAKDRLYIRSEDGHARRACQTVLWAVLRAMQAAIAPIMPHMAEDSYQATATARGGAAGANTDSVFQQPWPAASPEWASLSDADVAFWESLLLLRAEVNKVFEAARVDKVVGANLDGKLSLHVADAAFRARLSTFADKAAEADGVDELRYLLLVSEVRTLANISISYHLSLFLDLSLPCPATPVLPRLCCSTRRSCLLSRHFCLEMQSTRRAGALPHGTNVEHSAFPPPFRACDYVLRWSWSRPRRRQRAPHTAARRRSRGLAR